MVAWLLLVVLHIKPGVITSRLNKVRSPRQSQQILKHIFLRHPLIVVLMLPAKPTGMAAIFGSHWFGQ